MFYSWIPMLLIVAGSLVIGRAITRACGQQRWWGIEPAVGFDEGLAATLDWYLENEAWWRAILSGGYQAARRGSLTPSPCP